MNYSFNIGIFIKNFLPTRKRTAKHISWLNALLKPMQFNSVQFFSNYKEGFSGDKVFGYDATKTYNVGQWVYYNGFIYVNILASTGNLPTNSTYFSIETFAFGDLIQSPDNQVYLCIKDNSTGVAPINTEYWYLMQPNFLGLDKRVKANAQILVFEWILNKWFGTNFNYPASTNDVYITNNPTDLNGWIVGASENESSNVVSTYNEQIEFINASYSTATYSYTINIPLNVYDALKPTDASGITTTKDAIVKNFADKYNLSGLLYIINPY